MREKRAVCLLILLVLVSSGTIKTVLGSESDLETTWFHADAHVFQINYVLPLQIPSETNMTVDIAVPQDSSFQTVLSIVSNPEPNSTFVDAYGTIRYRYVLSTVSPKFVNITLNYQVLVLFSWLIQLPDEDTLDGIPNEIKEEYTTAEPYIESDRSEIVGYASQLVRDGQTVYQKVRKLFDFVSNRTIFSYNETSSEIIPKSSNHVRGALWALRNRQGVCFDFAHLFTALLRAIDIPARVSEGIFLGGDFGFIIHDWVEVYFPRLGWVPFNPTNNVLGGNVHMKILNPVYDQYLRWNSTSKGTTYPSNIVYEQAYVECVSNGKVIDTVNMQQFSLTRKIILNDNNYDSCLVLNNNKKQFLSSFTNLQTSLNQFYGLSMFKYSVNFAYPPEKIDLVANAPLNLIIGLTYMTPSLSSLTVDINLGSIYYIFTIHTILILLIVLISIMVFLYI